ncbi:uncharacterized protein BO97DRAFT_170671 [Aspergillus homomorphus CBS 101889]|uniref:Uncharacterized protein n=1 Tax=Aspergillus homomorphus (strain CBS 101889) TaxID=1450537 RepID=A0A395HMU4_ASPHC|nr:hypothetical protein BO97DRAFT_170671 [Aspergillus homomorphus CBS 101889]RAL09251.1 hypothetical protein BO97DRAFT_170671 [Aspergillus homomorphus CBS 101889]
MCLCSLSPSFTASLALCHVAETTPDRWPLIAHRSPQYGIHAPQQHRCKVFCCSTFLMIPTVVWSVRRPPHR